MSVSSAHHPARCLPPSLCGMIREDTRVPGRRTSLPSWASARAQVLARRGGSCKRERDVRQRDLARQSVLRRAGLTWSLKPFTSRHEAGEEPGLSLPNTNTKQRRLLRRTSEFTDGLRLLASCLRLPGAADSLTLGTEIEGLAALKPFCRRTDELTGQPRSGSSSLMSSLCEVTGRLSRVEARHGLASIVQLVPARGPVQGGGSGARRSTDDCVKAGAGRCDATRPVIALSLASLL